MKILILGSNGLIGRYFYEILKPSKFNQIYTLSSSSSNKFRKNHSAIDLNKDIKKLYNLIIKNNFDQIINCLFIKNSKGEIDTNIPRKIINFIIRKKLNKIQWVDISTFSIFLKNKNHYMIEKKKYELFLIRKFRPNFTNLKILRIGNFIEEPYLSKILFFRVFYFTFIPSTPDNNVFISSKLHIKYFVSQHQKKNQLFYNLVTKSNIGQLLKNNKKNKKVIYLHLNDRIFTWLKNFMKKNQRDKFNNFLNLFFS